MSCTQTTYEDNKFYVIWKRSVKAWTIKDCCSSLGALYNWTIISFWSLKNEITISHLFSFCNKFILICVFFFLFCFTKIFVFHRDLLLEDAIQRVRYMACNKYDKIHVNKHTYRTTDIRPIYFIFCVWFLVDNKKPIKRHLNELSTLPRHAIRQSHSYTRTNTNIYTHTKTYFHENYFIRPKKIALNVSNK